MMGMMGTTRTPLPKSNELDSYTDSMFAKESKPMTNEYRFNPAVYSWARERAGYTEEEATKKLPIKDAFGKSALERLKEIESGVTVPSKTVVKGMAKWYHCPEMVLNHGQIPAERDYGVDFRTVPKEVSKIHKGILNSAVGAIRTHQMYIKAVLEDLNEIENLSFVGSMSVSDGFDNISVSTRRTINFDRHVFRRQSSPNCAFAYLRHLVESCGVFVLLYDNLGTFHTSLAPSVFKGFSLSDDNVPFIVLNANDSATDWSYTLFQGLAHIWIGTNRICNNISDKIETLCDRVAQESLIPDTDLKDMQLHCTQSPIDMLDKIAEFAKNLNVSTSVLLCRLLESDYINTAQYGRLNEIVKSIENENHRKHGKPNGSNFYNVRRKRLGPLYYEFVKRMVGIGEIMPTKASYLTGVPATRVHKFLGLI